MIAQSVSLLLGLACVVGHDDKPAPPAKPAVALTAEDKKFLDGLLKDFLFDPKGAERVAVKTVVRSVWASSGSASAEGWLVPAKGDKPARVYFADGASIAAPPEKEIKKVDFLAGCKSRFTPPAVEEKKDSDPQEGLDRDKVFRHMRRTAVGAIFEDDLILSAWLYRLGHEELAAKALAAARKEEGDPRKRLRNELAWSAFAGMVHAYMVRADAEALAHGERLLRYPGEVKSKDNHYGQATQIVEELKRRQKKGTFGKTPPEKWPDGFDKWDIKKKADYLIDALDEVDARQWSQPGGVDLASDRRVEALIQLGDAVVPQLLDALENDERLTRSVQFGRDYFPGRFVPSVRAAVENALTGILRVRDFDPTGAINDSRYGEPANWKTWAAQVRAYWKEYGHLPLDERMMKVLTNPKATLHAKDEAVQNLANPEQNRFLPRTIYPPGSPAAPPRKVNPAVAKYSNPTVAEATLAALDAELKAFDARIPKEILKFNISTRRSIEQRYLTALVDLGDMRVGKELAKRSSAARETDVRRIWGEAAHNLGESKPLRALIDDFLAGKLNDLGEDAGERELMNLVSTFVRVRTPEADHALERVADPKSPHLNVLTERLLFQTVSSAEERYFGHPYCLAVLRRALDDTALTGDTIVLSKDDVRRSGKHGFSAQSTPKFLADATQCRGEVEERICDRAAEQLGELVLGLPTYHPLFKDAENRRDQFRAAFDRFAGHYRRAQWREARTLDVDSWSPAYIPDIRPLGRPATAEDVKAGKAVFSLGEKAKLVEMNLPAVGVLNGDEKKGRVLIVQAEVGPDEAVTYGIIARGSIRAVPGKEVSNIKTFAELDQEEAAERAKAKTEKK